MGQPALLFEASQLNGGQYEGDKTAFISFDPVEEIAINGRNISLRRMESQKKMRQDSDEFDFSFCHQITEKIPLEDLFVAFEGRPNFSRESLPSQMLAEYLSNFENKTSMPPAEPSDPVSGDRSGVRLATLSTAGQLDHQQNFKPSEGDQEQDHGYGLLGGYLGYEFVQNIEKIPLPENKNREGDGILYLFRHALVFDFKTQSIRLYSHRFSDRDQDLDLNRLHRELAQYIEKKLECDSHRYLDLKKQTDQLVRGSKHFGTVPDDSKSMLGKEAFVEAIGEIKEAIHRGDIFQCVLSDQFRSPFRQDPLGVYTILRLENPSPYHFYLDMREGVLLGASPERLVSVHANEVKTSPIAGTRPRGLTLEEDLSLEGELLRDEKEIAEHMMLVDLGRNDIGRISKPGSVRVEKLMAVERFSKVMHLVSNVRGELDSSRHSFESLLACFPAGTLSGAPKVSAMKLISRLEPLQRGAYGGALVFQDFADHFESCICIRSCYFDGEYSYVRAGAGVVADSNAEKEYQEVLNKASAVLRAIAQSKERS